MKVGGVISSFFQLVLGVPSKLILDIIDKGLEISKVFLKENLTIKSHNRIDAFVAAFILKLSEANGATEI